MEERRSEEGEVREKGVNVFEVKVESEEREYMKEILGSGGYEIVENMEKLKVEMNEIYRMLEG